MNKHRFKIDDGVILLPSVRAVGVGDCSIGLEGKIMKVWRDGLNYSVNVPCSKCMCTHHWSIDDYQLRRKLQTKQLFLWEVI
jgi:hypothetical protein